LDKVPFSNTDHVFVIAEAGSNWKCGNFEEDLEQSKKLIDVAVNAGADAIKFQTYKPKTTYVQDAGKSDYLSKQGMAKNINDIFEYLSMPYEMIPKLQKYCKEKKIMFMSTPFSIQDAEAVDPFVEVHKIASFEINHVRLLEHIFKKKKPIIISTGASTYDEIDFAVNLAKKHDVNFSLLQCTSKYPCSIDDLNLGTIPKLSEKYKVPIGLSDHSIDPIVGPIVAVSLGAQIIEKHFTLDRELPGPDHSFALEPNELKTMIEAIRNVEMAIGSSEKKVFRVEEELQKFAKRSIQAIRNVEMAIGSSEKKVFRVEEELQKFAKRSIQAIKNIKKDEILEEGINYEVLRPGNRIRGIEPRFLKQIEGKRTVSDIKSGDGITEYK